MKTKQWQIDQEGPMKQITNRSSITVFIMEEAVDFYKFIEVKTFVILPIIYLVLVETINASRMGSWMKERKKKSPKYQNSCS